MMTMRLVAADDSELALAIVRHQFEAVGVEVHTIGHAIGLSRMLYALGPDIVVLDINMPAIRGDEAVVAVKRLCPKARIVFFSDDSRTPDLARQHGVAHVMKSRLDRLVPVAMGARS